MSSNPYSPRPAGHRPDGLADVLERVLDKGLVIAGDIQLNLLDIEVLTLKVRLLVASADTAQQMGIDWWRRDPFLSSTAGVERFEVEEDSEGGRAVVERRGRNATDVESLERRIAELEAQLAKHEEHGDEQTGVGRRATVPQNRTVADDDDPWQEADAQARRDRATQQERSASVPSTADTSREDARREEGSDQDEAEGEGDDPSAPGGDLP